MKRLIPATVFMMFASGPVMAQVSIQTLRPTLSNSSVMVEGATSTGKIVQSKVQYGFLNDPLVEFDENHETKTGVLVDSIQSLDFGMSVEIVRWFELGAMIPVNLVHLARGPQKFAFGDSHLIGKIAILEDRRTRSKISLVPEWRIPTGNSASYVGYGRAGYGLLLIGDRDLGPLTARANFGFRNNPGSVTDDIDFRNMVVVGLGLESPITRNLSLNAEFLGQVALPVSPFNNPGELFLGGGYQVTPEMRVNGGISVLGVGPQAGADLRGVINLCLM